MNYKALTGLLKLPFKEILAIRPEMKKSLAAKSHLPGIVAYLFKHAGTKNKWNRERFNKVRTSFFFYAFSRFYLFLHAALRHSIWHEALEAKMSFYRSERKLLFH